MAKRAASIRGIGKFDRGERARECGSTRVVDGEIYCLGEKVVFAGGDQVGKLEIGEDAQPGAAWGGLAGEGDDGDAHPEGIAGGGDAVIDEGVETDVDAVEGAEVFAAALAANEFDVIAAKQRADALGVAGWIRTGGV